jgi:hypothetical protein
MLPEKLKASLIAHLAEVLSGKWVSKAFDTKPFLSPPSFIWVFIEHPDPYSGQSCSSCQKIKPE